MKTYILPEELRREVFNLLDNYLRPNMYIDTVLYKLSQLNECEAPTVKPVAALFQPPKVSDE